MSTGGFTRAQHPWLKDERLPPQHSPLQEQGPLPGPRKIRKKSIRNAKDSAEMARIKYHRRWGKDAAQPQESMTSKLGRHFGAGAASHNAQSRNEPDGTRFRRAATQPILSTQQASPPTPPQTSGTQEPPGFYWHDRLHESAAALNWLPPSGNELMERKGSFDSSHLIPGRNSSDTHLPLYGSSSKSEGHTLRRLRSPSLDSTKPIIQKQDNSVHQRPKTAGVIDASFLEVPIPHYRLGTPQFSERGTAFLHNSLHTAFSSAVDLTSTPISNDNTRLYPPPLNQRQPILTPTRRSPTSWFSPSGTPAPEDLQPSAFATPSPEQNVMSGVYDKFAANPENPLWIRYAPDGKMVGATTARLIMEITSVRFLDYELLSDFFLTYRAFMTPADLAQHLFARLGWAVAQSDSTGRIVRVRTFVALRHWVLNYFVDDFESDYALRVLFCDLVNKLTLELQKRQAGGGGDLQVLNELKKCWKRTCALVWDTDDDSEHGLSFAPSDAVSSDSGIGIPNMPSGPLIRGEASAPNQDRDILNPGGQSYFAPARLDTTRRVQVPESPYSEKSIHATSCSIPMRKRSRPNFKSEKPMKEKARPEVSHPPQQLQRRSSQRHQRNGSFSDALRDDRTPAPAIQIETATVQESPELILRGGLIRGTLLPPNRANVVIPGPLSPVDLAVHDRRRDPHADSLLHPDATSNPAVLKLLGGVRRALSTRHTSKPSLPGGHKPSSSGDLRRLRETHSLSRQPTVLEQSAKRELLRSDALAALVARSWDEQPRSTEDAEDGPPQSATSAQSQVIPAKDRPLGPTRFNSHVTTSSRSILIVDDTGIAGPSLSQSLGPNMAPSRKMSISEHGGMTATVRDMEVNDTSFLLHNLGSPLAAPCQIDLQNSKRLTTRTTSASTSILSAPLSPPPNMPLPPLPSQKSSFSPTQRQSETQITTPLSQIGLAIGTPLQQESPSLRETMRDSEASSPSILSTSLEDSPPRLLRRRPGGNLKAVDTIQDLGFLHRRQSTGSVSSPAYSNPVSPITSSDFDSVQLVRSWSRAKLKDRAMDGQLRDSLGRSSLRLLSTHSSQPNLRPSFEAEFRKLASLPGNEEEGDIESTLLKLEGRYQPSRHSAVTECISSNGDEYPALTRNNLDAKDSCFLDPSGTSRLDLDEDTLSPGTQGASFYNISQASHGTVLLSPHNALADTSPNMDKETKRWKRSSRALWSPELQQTSPDSQQIHSRNKPSVEIRDFANSTVRHHVRDKSEATVASDHTNSSFLLDDNESLLGRKSFKRVGKATRGGSQEEMSHSFLFDEEEDEDATGAPANEGHRIHHDQRPLTPPTTAGASSDAASVGASVSLLTPGPVPETEARTLSSPGPVAERPQEVYDLEKQLNHTPRKQRKAPPSRLHLPRHIPTHHTPFILAYSSSALAAQFTLIEKDALDCIDWKDLVTLSWSQDSYTIRDWAQYTHSLSSPTSKISSVDLIIARFNLVIKWCISSVLLCATPEDRAMCITKFIHVVTYAHTKLRNFATTAQITIGLLSSDLTRLTKTWDLVGVAEKNILKKLEILVSPVRNFAALRSEMESAAATLDEAAVGEDKGVIPFVGVYTRDLALNAQKPAFIAPDNGLGSKDLEQLINFERHRTAATIVKGVLRLLDASSRYTIRPQQEVLSRCLWLAALADGELASLSKGLE